MTDVSPVPAAIDALKAALSTAFAAEPAVGIYDGPQRRENVPEYEVIQLGIGNPAADEDPARGGAGHTFMVSFTVRNTLWAWNGDRDYAAARVRCRAMFATVRAVLAADKTLGGVVMDAKLGKRQWQQRTSGDGVAVSVGFAINFEAMAS